MSVKPQWPKHRYQFLVQRNFMTLRRAEVSEFVFSQLLEVSSSDDMVLKRCLTHHVISNH